MALTLPSSSTTSSTTNALAVDIRSLNALKVDAGAANSAQATREVAKQFESLFMRELIKSMRDATMKSGLMEGEQANLGQDMLDQQLSISMSGLQGGLSEAIARQLSRQMGGADTSFSVPSTLSLPQAQPRATLPSASPLAEATTQVPRATWARTCWTSNCRCRCLGSLGACRKRLHGNSRARWVWQSPPSRCLPR